MTVEAVSLVFEDGFVCVPEMLNDEFRSFSTFTVLAMSMCLCVYIDIYEHAVYDTACTHTYTHIQ